MNLRILSAAEEEGQEAARWYERRQAGLGDAFLESLQIALAAIERNPARFSSAIGTPSERNVRRALLDRFPYAIIFEILETEVLVLAISHTRRKPGYWLTRNGGAV